MLLISYINSTPIKYNINTIYNGLVYNLGYYIVLENNYFLNELINKFLEAIKIIN
jgi:hypothetical protein